MSSDTFMGSAAPFLPHDPNAKFLFAVKITREGGDTHPYCLSVPTSEHLAADQGVLVATRAYLDPATKTGPLGSELLPPVVVTFAP